MTGARKCLFDWLVDEGFANALKELEAPDVNSSYYSGGGGSKGGTATKGASPGVSLSASKPTTSVQDGQARILDLIDRLPFATVRCKKEKTWGAFQDRVYESKDARTLGMHLR
jgi:hypothetical protein